jgi:hypothetical protein
VNHDPVGPEVMKQVVECQQCGENGRGATGGSSCNVAVRNDLIAEGCCVLNCGKAASWLPPYGFKPMFKDVEERPAGQHPLVQDCSWEFVPKEENSRVVEQFEPRPESAIGKGSPGRFP